MSLWTQILDTPDPLLTDRRLDPARDVAGVGQSVTVSVPPEVTAPLLTRVPAAFYGGVNDVLLTGFALAVGQWRRCHGRGAGSAVLIDVEGHGREEIVDGVDLSRTVGWFTSLFPVCLDPGVVVWDQLCGGGPVVGQAIKRVKEQLRVLPDRGIGFGLLRYLNAETGPVLAALPSPQIGFNYLGRFSPAKTAGAGQSGEWTLAPEPVVLAGGGDPEMPLAHGLEFNALVRDQQDGPWLDATFSWSSALWSDHDIEELTQYWVQALQALVDHGSRPEAGGHTPTDFPLITLSQYQVDELGTVFPDAVDVLPLSPLQEGLLFHALYDSSGVDVYTVQHVFAVEGPLDGSVLQAAVAALLDRHPNLRAGFPRLDSGQAVQLIPRQVSLPWQEIDLGGCSEAEADAEMAQLTAREYGHRFDLSCPPLLRFVLVHLNSQQHRLVMTSHHILMDGWSTPVFFRELLALYAARGDGSGLPRVTPYRDYLAWLASQDRPAAELAWRQALAGLDHSTHLAPVDPARASVIPDKISVVIPDRKSVV